MLNSMDKPDEFRALRIDAKLSIKKAAELFRVSQATVKRWEKSNNQPHLRNIKNEIGETNKYSRYTLKQETPLTRTIKSNVN
jgi:transcriptional regulator with XRE-family HTH domain